MSLLHLRVDGGGGGARRPRRAGRGLGPVLEATLLMAGSSAGPCLGGAGRGPGQRPPAMAGQVAVGEAQDDGFFGAAARRSTSSRRTPPERDGSGPRRSCGTSPGLARESLAGVNDGREDRISRWELSGACQARGSTGIGCGRPVAPRLVRPGPGRHQENEMQLDSAGLDGT
jgi:hypothetical protein